jgi:hypothetical protein
VVIAVVAVGAVGGVWEATRSGSSAPPAAAASTSTSVTFPASTTEAITVPETATSPQRSTSPQPSTSLAISPPVSAPGSLTYTRAAGTTIKVVASNPCWIEIRASAVGPITRVTTLQAGQTLSLSSPLWMRLGNPANVHVTSGTTAFELPSGPGDLVIRSA